MKPSCCDKSSMKRGLWSEDEDAKILEYVSKHGTGKWTSVSKRAGLGRCGKSCRLRRTNNNNQRPDLKHEDFTPKEEDLIIKLHAAIGSRWSMIAQQLPGRTDNDVKNYWNAKLKKRLTDMGIDPVTHKPFSQIFASYGSVGGLSKPGMRIGSFNKDLKNAMVIKTDTSPIALPNTNSPLLMPMPSQANIVSPKGEPSKDNFLNHKKSLDLLAELQAINLVKEASYYNPITANYRIEGAFSSSSSSSSSSTCSSAAQDVLPVAFNWNEFLLEDEFLPNEAQECQEHNKVEVPKGGDIGIAVSSNEANEKTPCESSFVETLLAKESEMLMEFPDLMGDGFY